MEVKNVEINKTKNLELKNRELETNVEFCNQQIKELK
jgi:hypothetical protein